MKRNSMDLKYAEGYLVAFKNSFCEKENGQQFRCNEGCPFRGEDSKCSVNKAIVRLQKGEYNEPQVT